MTAPAWARRPATRQHHLPSTSQKYGAKSSVITPLSSIEGRARLKRAAARQPLAGLIRYYEAQTASMCGPTSAAVVLNALENRLPRHRRHTQHSMLACSGKTIRQVRGLDPVRVAGKSVIDRGLSLQQLQGVLRGHNANTRLTRVTCASDSKIGKTRFDLVRALSHEGCYVIANFSRSALGQRGRGHFSPIGAYDKVSDSFLVVDVNRKMGWNWVDASALVNAMGPAGRQSRGYLVISQ